MSANNLDNRGQIWPRFAQGWPSLARVRPSLQRMGKFGATLGPLWPRFGWFGAKLVKAGCKLLQAKVGSTNRGQRETCLPTLGEILRTTSPMFGHQVRSNLAEFGLRPANIERNAAHVSRCLQSVGRSWPELVDVGDYAPRIWHNFGPHRDKFGDQAHGDWGSGAAAATAKLAELNDLVMRAPTATARSSIRSRMASATPAPRRPRARRRAQLIGCPGSHSRPARAATWAAPPHAG